MVGPEWAYGRCELAKNKVNHIHKSSRHVICSQSPAMYDWSSYVVAARWKKTNALQDEQHVVKGQGDHTSNDDWIHGIGKYLIF